MRCCLQPESVEVEYEDENDDENDGDDEEDDDDENDDEEDDDGSCIFVKKGRNGIVSVSTDAIEEFGRKIEKMAKKKLKKRAAHLKKTQKNIRVLRPVITEIVSNGAIS